MDTAAASDTNVCTIQYTSDLASLGEIRRELSELLGGSSLAGDQDAVDGLLLAASEAVANVIEHAHGCDGRQARIEVESVGAAVELRIFDSGGTTPDLEAAALPDPMSERGRGMFLIQTLADDCSFETTPAGEAFLRLVKGRTDGRC
jgi:serine/threonine-protein kinase RsbW